MLAKANLESFSLKLTMASIGKWRKKIKPTRSAMKPNWSRSQVLLLRRAFDALSDVCMLHSNIAKRRSRGWWLLPAAKLLRLLLYVFYVMDLFVEELYI